MVGDDQHAATLTAQGVHAVRDHPEGVDVQTRVGLVQDRELGLQDRHLQNLVALLLTAGESLVDRPAHERLVHLDELHPLLGQRGQDELDPVDFLALAQARMELVEMDQSFMSRSVNEGFSGGEKKRNEILQMAILEPKLAILDETDSGLDIDALRVVANGVNALRSEGRGMLVITHHQRLLDYIVPDRVHVMAAGQIVRSGDKDLALELEKHGYAGMTQQHSQVSRVPVGATLL